MANLLQLKITLPDLKPPVWRRVLVPDSLTFWEMHFVLQILFDWDNSHLFEFRQGRGTPNDFLTGTPPVHPDDDFGVPEWQQDPREVTLAAVLQAPKDKVTYVYDFGDYWVHDILVEEVTPLLPGPPAPAVRCLTGKRAAPLEDMGGPGGYYALLDALADKAAGKRKRLPSEFSGLGKFEPDAFDLAACNQDLALLPEIMEEQNELLAQYQRQQLDTPPPAPRLPLDPAALLAAMKSMFPPAPPKPPQKKKKPKE